MKQLAQQLNIDLADLCDVLLSTEALVTTCDSTPPDQIDIWIQDRIIVDPDGATSNDVDDLERCHIGTVLERYLMRWGFSGTRATNNEVMYRSERATLAVCVKTVCPQDADIIVANHFAQSAHIKWWNANTGRCETFGRPLVPPVDRVAQYKEVQARGLATFIQKNSDYGDAFATFGLIGVLVRISDKIHRALNISRTNVTLVSDETLDDTLLDLHNYAAMALILHANPKVPTLE